MSARPLPPTLRRWFIGVMLAAFASTQLLGLVHRVPHAQASGAAQVRDAGSALLGALFAHHHDDRDCKAFDQLACGDLAAATAGDVLAEPPGDTPVSAPGRAWQLAAQAAGFLARGPPARL